MSKTPLLFVPSSKNTRHHALNETSMKYWMFRLFDKAKALLNDCRRVYFCVNAILKRQALNMRISQLVPSLYPGDPSWYLGLALIYGRNVWLLKSEKDIPSSQHHRHATHIQFYAKHLHMWSREIRIWVSCEISGKLKPARNTWLNSQKNWKWLLLFFEFHTFYISLYMANRTGIYACNKKKCCIWFDFVVYQQQSKPMRRQLIDIYHKSKS